LVFSRGQVLKDETMDDAFILLCMDELGVTLPGNKWFFFFYGFTVDINLVKLHCYQHNQYRWFVPTEIMATNDVHKHIKWYFEFSN
jgi:colanic acid biosynthesis protein WcaH